MYRHIKSTFNLPDYTNLKSCGLPDWENPTSVSSFPYTAPEDGFYHGVYPANQWLDAPLGIDGVAVYSYKNPTATTGFNINLSSFVKKGDQITGTNMARGEFYPMKGTDRPSYYCIKY